MNRKAFFDAVRERPFGGRLSQEQVRGLEDLLAAAPADMALEPRLLLPHGPGPGGRNCALR